jgi:hypothetical protein
MAGRRHEDDHHACGCARPDGSCAGLTVRRLNAERVRELAEEIWTASSGTVMPARPALDPRDSRPGASAQAAYQRHRQEELTAWRQGWWWRAAALAAATIGGGLLIGLTVGVWLAWPMALAAALVTGWRVRFRPSASASVWRRQAATQRRTADALRPLEREGHLVVHDVTLPGWSASFDHLVIGPTGVWVIQSWRGARLPWLPRTPPWPARGTTAGPLPELRWEAAAIADLLASGSVIPVQPLLCIHGATLPQAQPSVESVPVATNGRSPRSSGTDRGCSPVTWSTPPPGPWNCSARRSERPQKRLDEAVLPTPAGRRSGRRTRAVARERVPARRRCRSSTHVRRRTCPPAARSSMRPRGQPASGRRRRGRTRTARGACGRNGSGPGPVAAPPPCPRGGHRITPARRRLPVGEGPASHLHPRGLPARRQCGRTRRGARSGRPAITLYRFARERCSPQCRRILDGSHHAALPSTRNRPRTAMHRRCQSRLVEPRAARMMMLRRSWPQSTTRGPCQKVARNSAARLLTTPHDATLDSASHLRGCAGI